MSEILFSFLYIAFVTIKIISVHFHKKIRNIGQDHYWGHRMSKSKSIKNVHIVLQVNNYILTDLLQQYDVEIQHSVLKELLGTALINGLSSTGAAPSCCLSASQGSWQRFPWLRWLYKGPAERLNPPHFIERFWVNLSYVFVDSALIWKLWQWINLCLNLYCRLNPSLTNHDKNCLWYLQ